MFFKRFHTSDDQTLVQVVKQAIRDNEAVSDISRRVHVSADHGNVVLDGFVPTEKEMNLITNTAGAFASMEHVTNHLEVTHGR